MACGEAHSRRDCRETQIAHALKPSHPVLRPLLFLPLLILWGCANVFPTPLSPSPTPIVLGDSGWIQTEMGVEFRSRKILDYPDHPPLFIVRLNPSLMQFRVAYRPEQPTMLSLWCDAHRVVAAINGGFFDAHYRATAMVVSNGETHGTSYQAQGGMFSVDRAERISLRSLAEHPYDPTEPIQEAIQGWPMLIKPGGILGYVNPNDNQHARRSVVAIDTQGSVLFLVFPSSSLTLHELAQWLATSDLALDAALNLDGGSSTGLCLISGDVYKRIDSFGPLPLLLTAQRRTP